MKLYQAICADPAWQPKDKLPGKGRGASKNYKTMPTADICGLARTFMKYRGDDAYRQLYLYMSDKACAVAPDALLGLWRLSSMQTDALDVVKAWGFTHKTELPWVKYFPCKPCGGTGLIFTPTSEETCELCTFGGKKLWLAGCGTPWFGMGRYLRNAHETCVIATRGAMTKNIKAKNIRTVLHAPVPWDWERKRIDKAGRVHTGGPIHSAKPEKFYTQIIEKLVDGPYLELFGRRRRRGWTVLGNQVDKFARVA